MFFLCVKYNSITFVPITMNANNEIVGMQNTYFYTEGFFLLYSVINVHQSLKN